jgi:hypothetical protein
MTAAGRACSPTDDPAVTDLLVMGSSFVPTACFGQWRKIGGRGMVEPGSDAAALP